MSEWLIARKGLDEIEHQSCGNGNGAVARVDGKIDFSDVFFLKVHVNIIIFLNNQFVFVTGVFFFLCV